MGLSFKSHLKHLTLKGCRLAQWYRVGFVTNSEKCFGSNTVKLFFSYFMTFFLLYTRKVLGSLFSIEYFTKHLFHILILYLMFILKQNTIYIYIKHALTAWLIVLHIS